MTKLVVAVDIHDVLGGYIERCIYEYGWPEKWTVPMTSMWPDVDWKRHFSPDHHAIFLDNIRLIRGAKDGLRKLAESEKYEPFIYTATHGGGMDEMITRQWLRHHRLPNLMVLFAGGIGEKAKSLADSRVKCHWVIDDHPWVLRPLVNRRKPKIIVFDAPWNRDIMTEHRARTWKDVLAILEVD